jgi:deoxycytidylate deaminase
MGDLLFYLSKEIEIAKENAIKSDLLQKHGSVLICNGQIFTGYNHFTPGKNYITIHAEEDAIGKFINMCRKKYWADTYIRKKLKKATLITIRVKNDEIKCSAPCHNCIQMIRNYEIKHIIYSNNVDKENSLENNVVIQKKKVRDIENRPSSGYRWRDKLKLNRSD